MYKKHKDIWKFLCVPSWTEMALRLTTVITENMYLKSTGSSIKLLKGYYYTQVL